MPGGTGNGLSFKRNGQSWRHAACLDYRADVYCMQAAAGQPALMLSGSCSHPGGQPTLKRTFGGSGGGLLLQPPLSATITDQLLAELRKRVWRRRWCSHMAFVQAARKSPDRRPGAAACRNQRRPLLRRGQRRGGLGAACAGWGSCSRAVGRSTARAQAGEAGRAGWQAVPRATAAAAAGPHLHRCQGPRPSGCAA